MNARLCPWCNNRPKIERADDALTRDAIRIKARMYCECGACGPWIYTRSDRGDAAANAAAAWDVLTHPGALAQ